MRRRSTITFFGRLGACGLVALSLGLGGCDDAPGVGMGGEGAGKIRYTAIHGGLGDTPGRFAYPRAIDHDGDGLWIIDKSARVQRIDPKTGACMTIFRMPEYDLGKPTGFCVAPGPDEKGVWAENLLYIADTHYHRVIVYRPPPAHVPGQRQQPTLVAQWGSHGAGPGQFYYLTDVAVALGSDKKSIERIYVSEYGGNDRVSVFSAKHEFLFSFGSPGLGEDPKAIEFNRPQSLAIRSRRDGGRELVVVDACNHRIGRFTLDGELIGWMGSFRTQGRQPGQFYFPYGVALMPDGTALISEFGGNRLQHVDLDAGVTLGVYGEGGREPGQLAAPWGVTVLNGLAYVLDSANNRVVGFEP